MSKASNTNKKSNEVLMSNIEIQKRNMINFLEKDRSKSIEEKELSVEEKFSYIENNIKDNVSEHFISEIKNELEKHEALERELKVSRETCQMLEDTLENFEDKILDSIADNGKLHQEIDSLKSEVIDLRIKLATTIRQRDNIKNKFNEMNSHIDYHRRAIAASEREITYLNAKLHIERSAK